MAREMKDSGIEWAGHIPQTWEIKRGKTILHLLERPVREDDGVITCFRDGEVTLRSKRREEGFTFSLQENGYQGIEPGDLVVHGMDGFAGAIGISDSRGKSTPVLSVMDSTENKRYIMYYLRCAAYCGLFMSLSTGIRVRSCDTNWNKLKNIIYIVPPIEEQNRISKFLDNEIARIDAVMEQTRTSIEEYKKLKQAVITQAVTKGIRPNRPVKDSGVDWLEEIPNSWKMVRGKGLFYETNDRSEEGNEELLTVSQYTGITPRSQKTVNMFEAETLEGYKICEIGDIAANTMWLWAGAIGVSKYRGVISPSYNIYRQLGTAYISQYLDYLLRVTPLVQHYESLSTGIRASRLRLYPEQFLSIRFPVPPIDEQQEIVNYLNSKIIEIGRLIENKEQFLHELENYKKSLIYEYVTGKKEAQ